MRFVCQLFLHELLTGSRSVFGGFWTILRSFWEAFWITFPAEAQKRKRVFGLHRRVRIASSFPENALFRLLFHPFFSEPCAGGHFDPIYVFLGLPWGTLGHHFGGRGRFWGRSEKMMQKVFKNGCASCTAKTVPGAVGPLKRDNPPVDCSQQDIASNTPCRA